MRGAWLVTGGSGFVGQALLQALEATRPAQPLWLAGRRAPEALPAGWQHWPLDLAAPTLALPAGVHTVLHLAGEKRDPARMPAINTEGAQRLAQAAAEAGVQRFVHLSSVGVYGAARHAGVVTEASAHTPRGPYETSKDAGERAVRDTCAARGLACVVLQPSNVVGLRHGHGLPLLGLLRTVARGWFRHFGHTEAWVNYVAVEDVAAALLAAAEHPNAPPTAIVNTPAPLAQFVGWAAAELGLPAPRQHLPRWLGAAAGAAGSAAAALLGRGMPFDSARYGELTNTTRYDGSALGRASGFAFPLGIEAALRAMVRQYRMKGLL